MLQDTLPVHAQRRQRDPGRPQPRLQLQTHSWLAPKGTSCLWSSAVSSGGSNVALLIVKWVNRTHWNANYFSSTRLNEMLKQCLWHRGDTQWVFKSSVLLKISRMLRMAYPPLWVPFRTVIITKSKILFPGLSCPELMLFFLWLRMLILFPIFLLILLQPSSSSPFRSLSLLFSSSFLHLYTVSIVRRQSKLCPSLLVLREKIPWVEWDVPPTHHTELATGQGQVCSWREKLMDSNPCLAKCQLVWPSRPFPKATLPAWNTFVTTPTSWSSCEIRGISDEQLAGLPYDVSK